MTIWTDSFVHLCSCNFALKDEKIFVIISVACWVMEKKITTIDCIFCYLSKETTAVETPDLLVCRLFTEKVSQHLLKSTLSVQHTTLPAGGDLYSGGSIKSPYVVVREVAVCQCVWVCVCELTNPVLPNATDKFSAVSENLESRAGTSVCSRCRTMYEWSGWLSVIKERSKVKMADPQGLGSAFHAHYLELISGMVAHLLMMPDICTM